MLPSSRDDHPPQTKLQNSDKKGSKQRRARYTRVTDMREKEATEGVGDLREITGISEESGAPIL